MRKLGIGTAVLAAAAVLAGVTALPAEAATYAPIIYQSDITWCVDDPSNSTVNDTGVVLWGGCGVAYTLYGEEWSAPASPYGGIQLKLGNGMCMDNRGRTAIGSQYVVKTCNGSSAQAFAYVCANDGSTRLIQPDNDMLELNGGAEANGTPIVVQRASGGTDDDAWFQATVTTPTGSC